MSAAAEVLDIRRKAAALVDREFQRTGSMMAAYVDVGAAVGASGSWLRKFIKGYEAKEPGVTLGFNIKSYYASICGRIEANNEARRTRLASLEERRHAADPSPDPAMAAMACRTPVSAAGEGDDLEIPAFLRREPK